MAPGRGGRGHNIGSRTCEGRGNGHGSHNQGSTHRNATDSHKMGQEDNIATENDSDKSSMDNSMDRHRRSNYYSTLSDDEASLDSIPTDVEYAQVLEVLMEKTGMTQQQLDEAINVARIRGGGSAPNEHQGAADTTKDSLGTAPVATPETIPPNTRMEKPNQRREPTNQLDRQHNPPMQIPMTRFAAMTPAEVLAQFRAYDPQTKLQSVPQFAKDNDVDEIVIGDILQTALDDERDASFSPVPPRRNKRKASPPPQRPSTSPDQLMATEELTTESTPTDAITTTMPTDEDPGNLFGLSALTEAPTDPVGTPMNAKKPNGLEEPTPMDVDTETRQLQQQNNAKTPNQLQQPAVTTNTNQMPRTSEAPRVDNVPVLDSQTTSSIHTYSVKVSFLAPKNNRTFEAYKAIKDLLHQMFDSAPLQILHAQDGPTITSAQSFPPSDTLHEYFNIITSGARVFVIFRMQTTSLFGTIKRDIYAYLETNKIFLRLQSSFAKCEMLRTTGILLGIHPNMKHIPQIMDLIKHRWKARLATDQRAQMVLTMPSKWRDRPAHEDTIPDFNIRIDNYTHRMGADLMATKALIIETTPPMMTYVNETMKSISQETCDIGIYVPTSWFVQHRDTVGPILSTHNAILQETRMSAVLGLAPEVLYSTDPITKKTILDTILATRDSNGEKLILSVEPTNSTEKNGRWFMTFHVKNQAEALHFIDNQLPDLCTTSPQFDGTKYSSFPHPRRPQRALNDDPKIYANHSIQNISKYFGNGTRQIPSPRRPRITVSTKATAQSTWAQRTAPPRPADRPKQTDGTKKLDIDTHLKNLSQRIETVITTAITNAVNRTTAPQATSQAPPPQLPSPSLPHRQSQQPPVSPTAPSNDYSTRLQRLEEAMASFQANQAEINRQHRVNMERDFTNRMTSNNASLIAQFAAMLEQNATAGTHPSTRTTEPSTQSLPHDNESATSRPDRGANHP